MIEVVNVTKRYFNLVALKDVSLRIPQGEVVGVLGPNGAGKSTLFKVITGILNPDGGQVRPLRTNWPGVAYKPDQLYFPSHMRVHEYLTLMCSLCNVPRNATKATVSTALERVNLAYAAEKRVRNLSKGMRQRLGLAQTLIDSAPLLLLDEPSNGLDPEGQVEIQNVIKSLHENGKTILLSSHQLNEVTDICTQLIILNKGQIRYRSSMEEALATRPHVTIEVDKPLAPMLPALRQLHPQIVIESNKLILNEDVIAVRRYALTMLLGAGYEIIRVEQQRTTLAEIYSKAIRE